MDILQDYAHSAYTLYNTCDPYLRPVRSSLTSLRTQLTPLITPYLNRALILAQDSPGILTVGVVLVFLLIAMQILNFLRRVMMFWVRVVTSLLFYGGLVLLGAAVWQRGVGRTLDDLLGWGQELSEVWWREYRRWEGYQNQATASAKSGGFGGGGGRRWS